MFGSRLVFFHMITSVPLSREVTAGKRNADGAETHGLKNANSRRSMVSLASSYASV